MENQKEYADIFIGQAAKKFLYANKEQLNVDVDYYKSVRNYYMAACSYIIKKYPYDNELLINASAMDIDKRPGASFSSLTYFTELFPCLLPVNADIDALHGEFLRYQELQRELRLILSGQFKISDLPLVLYIPVITPCMDSEKICVSVHMQKGTFLISICRTETSLTADIEDSLNGDRRELRKLLSKLRLSLVLSRCAKSIQHLQVTTYHHLPLINLSGHPLEKLGKHKIFVKLAKQSDYYMVVEAYESDWMSVGFNHYLMHVQSAGFEGGVLEGEATEDSPSVYLKAGHLMQLDTCLCTHGPCSQLQELEEEEPDALSRKRKMFMKDQYGRQMKKQKCSPYFVPELCHILALCEDRIPFVALADELLKQGIAHQGFQVDGDGAALCLTLVDVLSCPSLKDNEAVRLMRSDLLSCKFRKGVRVWKVESVVANCPLQSTNSKEQGVIQRVYFEYELQGSETMERIVESLQEDWLAVCHLYQAVSDFAHIYTENPTLQTGIEVKAFTYKRLTLAYGPNKCYTVSIQYRPTSKWFRLAYGTCCTSNVANCHSMVAVQLENLLNDTHSIALLAQIIPKARCHHGETPSTITFHIMTWYS
ncbi:Mediator of RNA polymerase II transcription subunit 14 [Lamellibrachia satsuma]|nr:Mediator of RNA polymerase II transcription subunit 14 [Lamellibrachia satsuma]